MRLKSSHLVDGFWIVAALSCIVVTIGKIHELTRQAHTGSLFSQLDMTYHQHLKEGGRSVDSENSFLALVAQWKPKIDWESCSLRSDAILDGWKTPVQISVDPLAINLRSAGRDRSFQTTDDIIASIMATAKSEPQARLGGEGPTAVP
jgi:hypothetical protein